MVLVSGLFRQCLPSPRGFPEPCWPYANPGSTDQKLFSTLANSVTFVQICLLALSSGSVFHGSRHNTKPAWDYVAWARPTSQQRQLQQLRVQTAVAEQALLLHCAVQLMQLGKQYSYTWTMPMVIWNVDGLADQNMVFRHWSRFIVPAVVLDLLQAAAPWACQIVSMTLPVCESA